MQNQDFWLATYVLRESGLQLTPLEEGSEPAMQIDELLESKTCWVYSPFAECLHAPIAGLWPDSARMLRYRLCFVTEWRLRIGMQKKLHSPKRQALDRPELRAHLQLTLKCL